MVKHTLKILRCSHTARFLKYVWPFYNIMHERVNLMASQVDFCHIDQPPSKKGEVVYRRNKNSVGESISQNSYITRKSSQSSTGFSKKFYGHNYYLSYKENYPEQDEDYADYADIFPAKITIAKHKHDQALERECDAAKALMNKKSNEKVIHHSDSTTRNRIDGD